MKKIFDNHMLELAFHLLSELLERRKSAPVSFVVCGGSALIATGLVPRTTKDVDILALWDDEKRIVNAEQLPTELK